MKLALASISGLAAAVLLYLVIGISMLPSKEHDSAVVKSVKTITVHCKDGSEYETTMDSEEEFRCDWKQLVFNR